MKRIITMLTLMVLTAVVMTAGCRPASEQKFLASDIEVSSNYVAIAHPAASYYAKQLAASENSADARTGEELLASLNALAVEMQANNDLKVQLLNQDYQTSQTVQEAMKLLGECLRVYANKQAVETPAPPTEAPAAP